jgi:hypothetical protein
MSSARLDEYMDPRLFAEWADIDEKLRCRINGRADGDFAHNVSGRTWGRRRVVPAPDELLVIVSRADARAYTYRTHAIAAESAAVILDRRGGDRRRTRQATIPDRRGGERRSRDVTAALRMYGWAIVHR